MLAHFNNDQPEEWMLLATLVGEADLAVREEQANPDWLPLLQQVTMAFREGTGNFKNPAFLSSSRAARRRNPELFSRGT